MVHQMKLPPLTPMICSYPECSNMIWITVKQKRELKTFNVLKYGDSSDVYCCKECQEKHLKELSEAEFLTKGNLKNREYALIIRGADISKRPKEPELHILTGTKTELRVKCVVEKLMSISAREKRKYLTAKEIQEFLLTEINNDLKGNPDRIQVTASEIMTKTGELFPNVVSIEYVNKKDRVLLLI